MTTTFTLRSQGRNSVMRNAKSMVVILAVITTSVDLAATASGQEHKKGDEVVVLNDTELKVGTETIGTVHKGEKLTVEKIQGNWLWVRGKISGWIDSSRVVKVGAGVAGTVTVRYYQSGSPQFDNIVVNWSYKLRARARTDTHELRKRVDEYRDKRRAILEEIRNQDPERRLKAKEELDRLLRGRPTPSWRPSIADRRASREKDLEELVKSLSQVTPYLQGEFGISSDVSSSSSVTIGGRQFELKYTECEEAADSLVSLSITLEEVSTRSKPLTQY